MYLTHFSQVLQEGKQIINAQPHQVLAREAYAVNEYAQHRAAIRGILQDFQDTGIGYRLPPVNGVAALKITSLQRSMSRAR